MIYMRYYPNFTRLGSDSIYLSSWKPHVPLQVKDNERHIEVAPGF